MLYVLGFGCLSEGNWLFDSTYGCRICELLHKGSDVDFGERISVSRWGNEENCIEGKNKEHTSFVFCVFSMKHKYKHDSMQTVNNCLKLKGNYYSPRIRLHLLGGKAVLCNRWCGTTVHQGRNLTSILQTLLEPENGHGSKKLQTGTFPNTTGIKSLRHQYFFYKIKISWNNVRFIKA